MEKQKKTSTHTHPPGTTPEYQCFLINILHLIFAFLLWSANKISAIKWHLKPKHTHTPPHSAKAIDLQGEIRYSNECFWTSQCTEDTGGRTNILECKVRISVWSCPEGVSINRNAGQVLLRPAHNVNLMTPIRDRRRFSRLPELPGKSFLNCVILI